VVDVAFVVVLCLSVGNKVDSSVVVSSVVVVVVLETVVVKVVGKGDIVVVDVVVKLSVKISVDEGSLLLLRISSDKLLNVSLSFSNESITFNRSANDSMSSFESSSSYSSVIASAVVDEISSSALVSLVDVGSSGVIVVDGKDVVVEGSAVLVVLGVVVVVEVVGVGMVVVVVEVVGVVVEVDVVEVVVVVVELVLELVEVEPDKTPSICLCSTVNLILIWFNRNLINKIKFKITGFEAENHSQIFYIFIQNSITAKMEQWRHDRVRITRMVQTKQMAYLMNEYRQESIAFVPIFRIVQMNMSSKWRLGIT